MGVDDLAHAHLRWGDHLEKLITHRHLPEQFMEMLGHHESDIIKEVIEWPAAEQRQQASH
jgi:hypothetical protein